MTTLFLIALSIIIVLSCVAGYYQFKLYKVNKNKQLQAKLNQQAWLEHRNKLITDIRFIAQSITQEQCEITEGCMRLQYLITRIDDSQNITEEFQHIFAHFNATKHMPIKEAYKALNKKEQFKLDKERANLETQNSPLVISDCKRLIGYSF